MSRPDYNQISNNYETPDYIYREILQVAQKEKFDIDVACSRGNIPARFYYTENNSGLTANWGNTYTTSTCFMNPPFKYLQDWLEKAFYEVNQVTTKCEVWAVIPGDRLNNQYFNTLLTSHNNWFIFVMTGKVNFINPDVDDEINEKNKKNGGLNTPIFIMYIGRNAGKYLQRWKKKCSIKGFFLNGC